MTCFDLSQTPHASETRSAREQRVAQLQADLERSGAALSAELRTPRLVGLFTRHLEVQNALIAELLRSRDRPQAAGK